MLQRKIHFKLKELLQELGKAEDRYKWKKHKFQKNKLYLILNSILTAAEISET